MTALPRRNRQTVLSATIYFCFLLSLVSAIGVAFLWDITIMNTSVFIIFFAFCAGIVGDLLMVVVFPYATAFPAEFTSTLSTGPLRPPSRFPFPPCPLCPSLCPSPRCRARNVLPTGAGRAPGVSGHGLLCNTLAIGQGVGHANPLFGFETYMMLLAGLQLLALMAFIRVDMLRRMRSHGRIPAAQLTALGSTEMVTMLLHMRALPTPPSARAPSLPPLPLLLPAAPCSQRCRPRHASGDRAL